jgi:hypothetical protein
MSNGKKTYTHEIADPFRRAINSYWIGPEFALDKLGPPNLVEVYYYPTPPTTSGLGPTPPTHPREIRQRIKISETALFSVVQSEIAAKTKLGDTINPIQQASTSTGTSLSKGPSLGGSAATLGSTSQVGFDEFVMKNFFPTFVTHSTETRTLSTTTFGENIITSPIDDIAFETIIPTVRKDFSPTSDPVLGTDDVKEEFLINFLEKKYEDITSNSIVSELQLPNFYDVLYKEGPISDTYLDDYINPLPDFTSNPAIQNYENTIVPISNFEELQRLSGYQSLFPLEIKISPTSTSFTSPVEFYNALKESSLDATLVYFYASPFPEGALGTMPGAPTDLRKPDVPFDYVTTQTTTTQMTSDPADIQVTTTVSNSNIKLDVFDLENWSKGLIYKRDDLDASGLGLANKVYLGPNSLSINLAENNVSDLQKIISSATFLAKIGDVVEGNLRSFKDINAGDRCYSEIVLYKVEKYSSPDDPTPIQSFWIPNNSQIDAIEYIDTQVKYNKNYFYKVNALSAVVASKYYYDPTSFACTWDLTPFSEQFLELQGIVGDRQGELEILKEQLANNIQDTFEALKNLSDLTNELKVTQKKYDDCEIQKNCINTTARVERLAELPGLIQSAAESYDQAWATEQSTRDKLDKLEDEVGELIDNSADLEAQINKNRIVNPGGVPHFEIDAITLPTVKLIKTELFSFDGSILDDPPIMPDVKFTSYIGIDNRITINMQGQIGEYKNKPVVLSSTEGSYIDALKLSRGYPIDPMIVYRTDDEIAGFEIYRTETMPLSYEDFSENIRYTTSTLQRSDYHLIYSWDSSHMDTIEPNKVYYYMVRAVDIHGHKSYPSHVYKVQMVNDVGAIYPLVEVFEMKPLEKLKTKTKNFQKIIQIAPTMAQKLIDFEKSGLIDSNGVIANSAIPHKKSIVLGIESPKVFGGAFKVRLVSKNTGKKLDLNLTFNVENLD